VEVRTESSGRFVEANAWEGAVEERRIEAAVVLELVPAVGLNATVSDSPVPGAKW